MRKGKEVLEGVGKERRRGEEEREGVERREK